jgi:hypothetical protein
VQKAREEKTLYTPRCLVVGGRGVHDKERVVSARVRWLYLLSASCLFAIYMHEYVEPLTSMGDL